MCLSHKVSFVFGILIVAMAVHPLWSSNSQVMALRDLPLMKKIILSDLSTCFSTCNTNEDCTNSCPVCGPIYRGQICFPSPPT
ncbi:hypothetical protein P3S67_032467 [Capsicum chacoense]